MSHSFPTLRSSYLLTVNEFTHHASRSYWSTSSQGPPLPWLITPAWLDCVGVVQPSPVQRLEMFMPARSEEHTSALQSLMRISYAVFCLKHKNTLNHNI